MSENAMMIPVPFHSDTVWAVDRDGDVLVAIKPIAESLGLKWNGQFERLKRSTILRKGIRVIRIPSPGGEQETTCLKLKWLPGWLLGVDSGRVKPEIREKLERYQEECFEVLWHYFRGEISAPETARQQLEGSTEVHLGIEASLSQHQLRVLAAAKAYGHNGVYDVYQATGLSRENSRRCTWLLVYLGILEAWEAPGGQATLRYVPPERRPGLPPPQLKRQQQKRKVRA